MKDKENLTKLGRHHYKKLTYKGIKVNIDTAIAPLLSNMWKLGINTWNSCEGLCSFECAHKNYIEKIKDGIEYWNKNKTKYCGNFVWLVFDRPEDLELFYNLVADPKDFNNDNSMYSRMLGYRHKEKPQEIWSTIYPMNNLGVIGHWGRPKSGKKRSTQMVWCEDDCKKNNFIISPQLTFPRSHLPYVEEKIKLALYKK